jgi:hypothetical protein
MPRVQAFVALWLGVAGCTLARPLDGYSAAYDKADGGADGGDSAAPTSDGCVGVPVITEPADNAVVGSSVQVKVSAPSCIVRMILYVDGNLTLHAYSNVIDGPVPIDLGTHVMNVNGWANTDISHPSAHVTVTRTK